MRVQVYHEQRHHAPAHGTSPEQRHQVLDALVEEDDEDDRGDPDAKSFVGSVEVDVFVGYALTGILVPT